MVVRTVQIMGMESSEMINAELKPVWGEKSWWENLDWKAFQEIWPLAVMDEKPKNTYSISGPCRLSYGEVHSLHLLGVELELLPLPGAMIVKMQDRKDWGYTEHLTSVEMQSGQAVQVTVPDMGVLFINEVQVLEDSCTDVLQEQLDAGWRMLAVCPPNAQRRPDYILGRVRKD